MDRTYILRMGIGAALIGAAPISAQSEAEAPTSIMPTAIDSTPAIEDAAAGEDVSAPEEQTEEEATSQSNFQPTLIPLSGTATDDADTVKKQVGAVRFEMAVCGEDSEAPRADERVVRGSLSRLPSDWRDRPSLINGLLALAAQYAWEACPHPYLLLGERLGGFQYDLHSVQWYGPDGALLFSARLGGLLFDGHGDQWSAPSRTGYLWLDFQESAPASQPQPIAENQEVPVVQFQPQSTFPSAAIDFSKLGEWLIGLIGVSALMWLLASYEQILCFLYSLKPHPAKRVVDDAIQRGASIDGTLYDALTTVENVNRYRAKARDKQARGLATRLREHESALRAEEAFRVEAERARVRNEIERLKAHSELREAGINHEEAAARLDEVRKRTHHDG